MLFKQMQYFVKVVELHSFTDAAEVLFVSQSAISQQIKALESELGVELFVRSNRHFHLTSAGEYFYQYAQKVLREIDDIKIKTKSIDEYKNTIIRIGYLKSYDGIALHQAIANFSKTYPQVELHIENGNHEELYEYLKSKKIDIALNDQRRAFSNQYVNFELSYCNCYVELPITHILSSNQTLTIAELKDMPCILVSSKKQMEIEKEFYQSVIGIKSEIIFADSMNEARLLVAANRGYLLLEGSSQSTSPTIKRIPLMQSNTILQRNYCAFWKKEMTNAYIEEFAEILKKEFMKENKHA